MNRYYPDGLTPAVIQALTTALTDTTAPQPTRALLDGTARERRERREARRALAAVVRSLPARPIPLHPVAPDGEAA